MNKRVKRSFIRRRQLCRSIPAWAWLCALVFYLLPLLLEYRWLPPETGLAERFPVYAIWLVPGTLLSFYLGIVGALVAMLGIVPFLVLWIRELIGAGTDISSLMTSYLAVLLVALILLGIMAEKFNRQADRLKHQSLTDELSNLYNHRYFYQCLEREVDRARRYKLPLSLVIIDLDNFKKYNDTWGHPQGDRALITTASILKEAVRTSDTVARYGGEEFAIILPQTDLIHAKQICERIREALAATPIPSPGGVTEPLTASFGIAAYESKMTPQKLVEEADRILYFAKSSGKNLVTCK